jgi:hypothetical protein
VADDPLAPAIAVETADTLFDPGSAQRQIEMYDRVGEAEVQAFFDRAIDDENGGIGRLRKRCDAVLVIFVPCFAALDEQDARRVIEPVFKRFMKRRRERRRGGEHHNFGMIDIDP